MASFKKPSLSLQTIDDDTLIHTFAFLSVPEILAVRQTCKRLYGVSKLHIVWHNACTIHVLQAGLPFPSAPLTTLDMSELEARTCHHFRIGQKWLASSSGEEMVVEEMITFDASASTIVSDVRFLPGSEGKWLLTVSKGIWSEIAAWEVSRPGNPRKMTEWSKKGAIFHRFTVNSDPNSVATVAVSVFQDGHRRIEILALDSGESGPMAFKSIAWINTAYNPMTLQGDLIAFSDDRAETVILNWKKWNWASVRHLPDEQNVFQLNRCIQVLFAHKSILVVRARSMHLFPEPVLRHSEALPYPPIAHHSWGWPDGVAVTSRKNPEHGSQPFEEISILIRAEVDDPWSSATPKLNLYALQPNPDFVAIPSSSSEASLVPHFEAPSGSLHTSAPEDLLPASSQVLPYTFPPALCTKVESVGGSLRCADIILGQHGTAVWIQPHDRARTGLVSTPASFGSESLVSAAFPGPMNHGERVEAKTLLVNPLNDWMSVDYNEEMGSIALGSRYGKVTLLSL